MRLRTKFAIATGLCGIAACLATAQDEDYRHSENGNSQVQTVSNRQTHSGGTLTEDDRLSILASALNARVRYFDRDCSHLVHAIYEEAGFSYNYEPSSQIYAGAAGFQRVKRPEPGDLVVWRGHVGIVIRPSQHIFFSYLSSGPGTDDYQAPYWKRRGHPRFYRYIKNCPGCEPAERQLLRVNR